MRWARQIDRQTTQRKTGKNDNIKTNFFQKDLDILSADYKFSSLHEIYVHMIILC